MPMTFGQFSEANRARCESPKGFNHPLTGWSTSDWMTALVGEVGEAANVVKKLNFAVAVGLLLAAFLFDTLYLSR